MVGAGHDNMLATVAVGVPQVADLIAGVAEDSRFVALDAAAQSYLRSARELEYGEDGAHQWAAVVMERLHDEIKHFAGAAISS